MCVFEPSFACATELGVGNACVCRRFVSTFGRRFWAVVCLPVLDTNEWSTVDYSASCTIMHCVDQYEQRRGYELYMCTVLLRQLLLCRRACHTLPGTVCLAAKRALKPVISAPAQHLHLKHCVVINRDGISCQPCLQQQLCTKSNSQPNASRAQALARTNNAIHSADTCFQALVQEARSRTFKKLRISQPRLHCCLRMTCRP